MWVNGRWARQDYNVCITVRISGNTGLHYIQIFDKYYLFLPINMHSAISLSTDNIIVTKPISIDRDLENYALCQVIACNKCIIKNVTLKIRIFLLHLCFINYAI